METDVAERFWQMVVPDMSSGLAGFMAAVSEQGQTDYRVDKFST